jgi:hypothetical protein
LQAGVLLLAGFFWVGVGFVMGWMFARPQEQVVTY